MSPSEDDLPDEERVSAADPDEPAAVALARILLDLAGVLEAEVAGSVLGDDPEHLHDLRVATRRSRSMLRQLRGVLPPAVEARGRAELRWVQAATGPARDLDVHLEALPDLASLLPDATRADLEPVEELLRQRRLVAHRQLRRDLRSERLTRFLASWPVDLADVRDGRSAGDRGARAARPIGRVAAKRIRKVHRAIGRRAAGVDGTATDAELHELRKQGKELRYLLDAFGDNFPTRVTKPLRRSLKDLQDVLGLHQDRVVQSEALEGLAPDLGAVPGGEAARTAVVLLVERLGAAIGETPDAAAGPLARLVAPGLVDAVDQLVRHRPAR